MTVRTPFFDSITSRGSPWCRSSIVGKCIAHGKSLCRFAQLIQHRWSLNVYGPLEAQAALSGLSM
jgi:hypothetical protein